MQGTAASDLRVLRRIAMVIDACGRPGMQQASTPPLARREDCRHAAALKNPRGNSMAGSFTSIGVSTADAVTTVEIQRPPNNFFDTVLIREIATALEAADADAGVRAVLLCAQGKAFCAGANFANRREDGTEEGAVPGGGPGPHPYKQAIRPVPPKKPIRAPG